MCADPDHSVGDLDPEILDDQDPDLVYCIKGLFIKNLFIYNAIMAICTTRILKVYR